VVEIGCAGIYGVLAISIEGDKMSEEMLTENDVELLKFLPEFTDAFKDQLISDFLRWGNTWKLRNVGNQDHRIFARFRDYWDQHVMGGVAIPWLKVIGNAYIAWVRENHPEALVDNKNLLDTD